MTTDQPRAPTSLDALPSGFELEGYLIDGVLGAGGFGITYRARDPLLDTWVAIKEYFPLELAYRDAQGIDLAPNRHGEVKVPDADTSYYAWGLERFLYEAQALAQIKHPHVLRVSRYFRANGTAYIVTDYEDGETLADTLAAEGRLAEEDVYGLLTDILPALATVHERGYLHRDLKPDNLYVRNQDGSVVLIDFGAAREAVGKNTYGLTALISPGYSPPEQYSGAGACVGPWSDLYALGAVLYHCVAGVPPPESVGRLLDDTLPTALQALVDRHRPGLLAVIERALALQPEHRYQTVAEMALDVERSYADDETESGHLCVARAAPGTPARAAVAPQRRLGLRAAGAVAVLAVSVQSVLLLQKASPHGSAEQAPKYTLRAKAPPHPSHGASPGASMAAAAAPDIRALDLARGAALQPPTGALPGANQEYVAQTTATVPSPPAETRLTAVPAEEGAEEDASLPAAVDAAIATAVADVPPALNADQNNGEWLLQQAEARLAANRLTVPASDSAFHYYQRLLALDPGNTKAQEGIDKIAAVYAQLATAALSKGDLDGAQRYIRRGLDIDPRHAELIGLENQASTLLPKQASPRVATKPTRRAVRQSAPKASERAPEQPGVISGLRKFFTSPGQSNPNLGGWSAR